MEQEAGDRRESNVPSRDVNEELEGQDENPHRKESLLEEKEEQDLPDRKSHANPLGSLGLLYELLKLGYSILGAHLNDLDPRGFFKLFTCLSISKNRWQSELYLY